MKTLERGITKYQKLVVDENGVYIRDYTDVHNKIKVYRLTYGQYSVYVYMKNTYRGLVEDAMLWGPGRLTQQENMTFNYYMEEY